MSIRLDENRYCMLSIQWPYRPLQLSNVEQSQRLLPKCTSTIRASATFDLLWNCKWIGKTFGILFLMNVNVPLIPRKRYLLEQNLNFIPRHKIFYVASGVMSEIHKMSVLKKKIRKKNTRNNAFFYETAMQALLFCLRFVMHWLWQYLVFLIWNTKFQV